jgi:hypothetical protein
MNSTLWLIPEGMFAQAGIACALLMASAAG